MVDVLPPVAILAGGLATRLRPVSEKIPKSLIEVAGEPFLAHQLRMLASQGARRVVLCCGYLGEMVRDFAGDGSRFGLEVDYSFDGPALAGTGGALRQALPLLGERFLTIYGDSYLPTSYAAVDADFAASGLPGLMTVFHNEGRWDTSNVEFSGGRLLAYDKQHRTPRMRHIDYGLGGFHRDALLEYGPAEGAFDLAGLYGRLLAAGRLYGREVKERFYEVGSFAGIQELDAYLRSEKG